MFQISGLCPVYNRLSRKRDFFRGDGVLAQQTTLEGYWHADRCDMRVASVRLRLVQPVEYLRKRGLSIDTSERPFDPARHDVVLFCKSVSAEAQDIAERAKAEGKIIIYDLCDNVFAGKKNKKTEQRSAAVRKMLAIADHAVFTTHVLRQQVLETVAYPIEQTTVIPDGLDRFLRGSDRRGGEIEQACQGIEGFLGKHQGALHCIWFGKSQGRKSGIAHIGRAVRELEEFSTRRPVTLTVVSNRPFRYWIHSRRWRIPHYYQEWQAENFGDILARHDVAVIPVEQNEYTLGKTINRPATAILSGLGVVADSIPAYEELRRYIAFDDWQAQLELYSTCPPAQDTRLAAAKSYLEGCYGIDRVGSMWLEMLSRLHRGKCDLVNVNMASACLREAGSSPSSMDHLTASR